MTRPAADSHPTVRELVAALPEVYQPIYGQPELSSSRTADAPRVGALLEVIDLLAAREDRPLRVLDLGAAQGYIACCIAARGHHVTGIDYLDANVAVSQAIAAEHPELDVEFVLGDVAEVEELVDISGFDVVVALSVLHHITYRDGQEAAAALVERLAQRIPHGVFEMALASEPPYWASAQPAAPRATIAAYPFIRELTLSATHLSEVERPTYFCSRTHALVGGTLAAVKSWTSRSHDQVGDEQTLSMRYFLLDGQITKVAARTADGVPDFILLAVRDDLRREATMLAAMARAGIDAPALVEFSDRGDETVLTRTAYEGRLVSELLPSLTIDERRSITTQVLDKLVELESHGLYHSDLRLWNVLFDRSGGRAWLIDFGALRAEPIDVVPPNDSYVSFAVFIGSLWSSHPDQTGEHLPRALDIDAAEVPPGIVDLIVTLLRHPRDGAVFADLAQRWASQPVEETPTLWPAIPIAWEWLRSNHERSLELSVAVRAAAEHTAALHDRIAAQDEHIAAKDERIATQDERIAAQDTALQEAVATAHRLSAELSEVREAVHAAEAQRQEASAAYDDLSQRAAAQLEQEVAHVAHLKAVVADLGQQLTAVTDHREVLTEALAATHRSISWRVTAPLRRLRHPLRGRAG